MHMSIDNNKVNPSGIVGASNSSVECTKQIDFGNYVLRQLGMDVGRVLVVATQMSSPATAGAVVTSTGSLPPNTTEHWCLYSNYLPPRMNSGPVVLEFFYEDCTFDPERKGTLEGFLDHVRKTAGARYIQAVCATLEPVLSS